MGSETMATFIVGNTKKVFNFGTSKVWDFSEAYRNASDGDVIQFQAGTIINLGQNRFTIEKNLSFVGDMKDDGSLTTSINGTILVTKGEIIYLNLQHHPPQYHQFFQVEMS